MNTACYKLMYISTAEYDFTDRQIEFLGKKIGPLNQSKGLTGVLYFRNGLFLQVLEGDQDTVTNLFYNKIRHDPRHHTATVIVEGDSRSRIFGGWDMFMAYGNVIPLLRGFDDTDPVNRVIMRRLPITDTDVIAYPEM